MALQFLMNSGASVSPEIGRLVTKARGRDRTRLSQGERGSGAPVVPAHLVPVHSITAPYHPGLHAINEPKSAKAALRLLRLLHGQTGLSWTENCESYAPFPSRNHALTAAGRGDSDRTGQIARRTGRTGRPATLYPDTGVLCAIFGCACGSQVKLYCDEPVDGAEVLLGGIVPLRGWALGQAGIPAVEIQIDNRRTCSDLLWQ